jgi:hypothetical protein
MGTAVRPKVIVPFQIDRAMVACLPAGHMYLTGRVRLDDSHRLVSEDVALVHECAHYLVEVTARGALVLGQHRPVLEVDHPGG